MHQIQLTPTQVRVRELVEAYPGIPVGKAGAMLGLSAGTMAHHVRRLRSMAILHTVVAGRRRLLFPTGELVAEPEARAISAIHGRAAAAISEAIIRSPGCGCAHVRQSTGLSRRAVYHHLSAFKKNGMVFCGNARGYESIYPTTRLLRALAAREALPTPTSTQASA